MAPLHLFKLAVSACGTQTGVLPSLFDNVPCGKDANGVPTPILNSVQDAVTILANVIRILMAVAGGIAVIVIVVAAIYYITSTGSPDRIKRARDIIQYTAIGLLLIILSYGIITYIGKQF
jgi:cytochrome bd-type quinol oxidase subunit 2